MSREEVTADPGGTSTLTRPLTAVSPVQPRPHQERALTALQRVFADTPRAQLHMACGTGKTHAAAFLAGRVDARVVVVLAPSLALVAQTAAVWRQVHPGAPAADRVLRPVDRCWCAGARRRAGSVCRPR